jgi:1-deoxy-D-xylulose-5-phosphate reductoisomerase
MFSYISSLQKAKFFPNTQRQLVILGSTGSIGCNALQIVQNNPEAFKIVALAGGSNVKLLARQANQFKPKTLAVKNALLAEQLKLGLESGYSPEILYGETGYNDIAALDEAQIILSAQVGAAGLGPSVSALKAGKVVALANKESLVLAGNLIREICQEFKGEILPVDSEHNAIFQSLQGHNPLEVDELILTASGGPFRDWSAQALKTVTPGQALRHPNWNMGAKISIDSATLMNKGLELIEAHYLFGLSTERIKVLVHEESIVHSLVQYQDGSLIAHLGQPDMQVPIAYCLSFPKRLRMKHLKLDFKKLAKLNFSLPDYDMFPCLKLAKDAILSGPSYPIALNAANELAVELFLQEKISFMDIFSINQKAVEIHNPCSITSLQDVQEMDILVREKVQKDIISTDFYKV